MMQIQYRWIDAALNEPPFQTATVDSFQEYLGRKKGAEEETGDNVTATFFYRFDDLTYDQRVEVIQGLAGEFTLELTNQPNDQAQLGPHAARAWMVKCFDLGMEARVIRPDTLSDFYPEIGISDVARIWLQALEQPAFVQWVQGICTQEGVFQLHPALQDALEQWIEELTEEQKSPFASEIAASGVNPQQVIAKLIYRITAPSHYDPDAASKIIDDCASDNLPELAP